MGYAHGEKWTDDLVKSRILEVKEALNIDRMPSRSECEAHFGNCALTNAVSRRGWYKLASELGLVMKNSETQLGKIFEQKAADMLSTKGFSVKRMSQNFPYDLLVDECVKVDVKASRLYRGKNGNFYTYNLEKPFATCDLYILFALSDDMRILRTMIIPSAIVHSNTQISVGEINSKYHKFTDRWDYIYAWSGFLREMSADRC